MKPLIVKIMFITIIISPFSLLDASSTTDDSAPWCVEFRAAYFRPSHETVREVYSDGWVDYQCELSKMLFSNWAVWGSVNWYKTKGHAACCGDVVVSTSETSLCVVPLSLGLQYFYPIPLVSNGRFYLAAGGSVAFVRIKDDSGFVKQHLSENGAMGWILKSGIQYFFQNNLFIDLFADYVFQPIHFSNGNGNVENNDASLDGVKLGIGLGLNF